MLYIIKSTYKTTNVSTVTVYNDENTPTYIYNVTSTGAKVSPKLRMIDGVKTDVGDFILKIGDATYEGNIADVTVGQEFGFGTYVEFCRALELELTNAS